VSYALNPDNAVPVVPYAPPQGAAAPDEDDELLNLIPFLFLLKDMSDVRSVLRLRGGHADIQR